MTGMPSIIQGARTNGPNIGFGELVALSVGAVAQAGIGDTDVKRIREGHYWSCFPVAAISRAISLPTLVAAAVMMSRFPA